MPPKCIRQLYNTVAIPAFTYAADIWFTGIHNAPSGLKRLGSVAITKKLSSIQRHMAKTLLAPLPEMFSSPTLTFFLLNCSLIKSNSEQLPGLPPYPHHTPSMRPLAKQPNALSKDTNPPSTTYSTQQESTPMKWN